jgi:two-component SAPR family response regulator
VLLHEGKLTLDGRYFWIDSRALEELAAEIDSAGANAAGVDALATRLMELYRGPFLATEADAPWQLDRRNRLRNRFARAAAALGRRWEQAGLAGKAAEFYEKCFEIDPLARASAALSHK